MKQLLPIILISFLFGSCLKDENFKQEYKGFTPLKLEDGWERSSPQNENMDAELINKAFELVFDDNRYTTARSLLVARNGKIVAEAYPNDNEDYNRIHNLQSCTKSFTSLAAGIALAEEKFDSLNQKLSSIYPENFINHADLKDITLRHALSMKAGLEFNNDVHTLLLYQEEESSVDFVLSQEKIYEPGQVLHYNDGAPHLVSAAIQKATGSKLADYTAQKLFEPLGIKDFLWESSKDGINYGAFSLYLKPRDFLKTGQLLLQNGVWEGTQIIDSTFLNEATKIQGAGNFNNMPYGLYFWIMPSHGAYMAEGHGGQFLLVCPDKNLCIVYTAFPYTNSMFFDEQTELIDLIYSSCK